MAIPFYAGHLAPEDYAGFEAEYREWLALVTTEIDALDCRPGSGGQVPPELLGLRSDSTRKARRVARLASRLVRREVR